MKVAWIEGKVKLAELDPKAEYLLIVNPVNIKMDTLKSVQLKANVQIVLAMYPHKDIRILEIEKPKKIK